MTDQQPKAESKSQDPTVGTVFADFLEHQIKAAQETGHALNALIPPDFRTHSTEASREFLT